MFSLHVFRRTALAGMIVLSMACTATAQTSPAESITGLGESWPNATDVSANPNWHAYVFQKDGVRYIQINDRNGTVHAAFGKAGEMVFALPVGVDAQRVDVIDALNPQGVAETIYQDESVTIEAVLQSDGVMKIATKNGCGDPLNCTAIQMPAQQ
jgi:hypothetical protein